MTKNTQLSKLKQILDEPLDSDISLFPLTSNKPTNPDVGDCWADAETLEIQTWDGNNWIVLKEPPAAPTFQFSDDSDTGMSAPHDNELTLIAGGVETLKVEPDKMCIYNNCTALVTIDTKTGDIEYGENYDPDETAKIFWEALAHVNPQTKDLNMYRQLYNDNREILDGVRQNLGVPEGECINKFTKKHNDGCAWYGWDHQYTFSKSDCTCFKIEKLEGGLPVGAMEDIQYFRDKLTRAMTLKRPTDKIEKQLEFLEETLPFVGKQIDMAAIINCPYIPECFESAQNKKAFDYAMKVIE